jgi:hypothetical protein
MDKTQDEKFREALDEKSKRVAEKAEPTTPPDNTDAQGVREKSSGHGKKTADKWNQ